MNNITHEKELRSNMKQFVKSIITTSISTAISMSAFFALTSANAATYQVIDKGNVEQLERTYAQQENNNGEMAISGTNLYNFPVQYDKLSEQDFDDIKVLADATYLNTVDLDPLEDLDALKAGNPSANDLAWVLLFLNSKSTGSKYQKIGDAVAMTNLGGASTTQEYLIFDKPFDGTTTLTRSTRDIIAGITDGGVTYGTGTAPYLPLDPIADASDTLVTYWLREFAERGFFSLDSNSDPIAIIPPETSLGGGVSSVSDVNESNVAVGYMSYKLNEVTATAITNTDGGCADPDLTQYVPFEVCVQNNQTQLYHKMAYKAELNNTGQVITTELGLLITPHPDDTRPHSSYALSINNLGVAVGYASGWNDETVTTNPDVNESASNSYAVVYKDGRVIDFNGDHAENIDSKAYDINDAGFAVGHTLRVVNGKGVQKFFYVDTNVDDTEMLLVTPVGFFTSSNSTARALNESGLVVGEGEIETHVATAQNPRRKAAFLYNINDDKFTNINDFLSCETPYNIIEARDINNNNEISATAIVKVDRRDAKGNYVLDANGERLKEDVVHAVSLVPINGGEIEDCSIVEEKIERQGGGFNFYLLLSLFGVLAFRKKFK